MPLANGAAAVTLQGLLQPKGSPSMFMPSFSNMPRLGEWIGRPIHLQTFDEGRVDEYGRLLREAPMGSALVCPLGNVLELLFEPLLAATKDPWQTQADVLIEDETPAAGVGRGLGGFMMSYGGLRNARL